jgi:4-diphosphocytidyl-2-C-methyl-D-erythritol kinase
VGPLHQLPTINYLTLVTFPNCKINLGLNITGKRADGFHDLETVFYPIAIKDVLEIVQQQHATKDVEFITSGLQIDADTADNLCVKAYHLLKNDFTRLPPVKMHLHKAIPMGAGLGGGSADGAFTLKLLNEKFQLGLTIQQLINYALQLGSDCPFFILNQPCFAGGRGEKLQPVSPDLSGYRFLVVNPGVHINTGWAFSQVRPKQPVKSIKAVIGQPVDRWKAQLVNDFEEPVFQSYPEIKAIKENLYTQGAVFASMTGSGSTVFGIFEKHQDLRPLIQQYSTLLTHVV